MKKCNRRELWLSAVFAYISLIAFRMNLLKTDYTGNPIKRYLSSITGFSFEQVFFLAGLVGIFYFLLRKIQQYRPEDRKAFKRELCYAVILGGLFSVFMIVGKSIEVNGNLSALYKGKVQILKTFTVFSGYACLFSTLILCLYYMWDGTDLCKKTVGENKHIIGRWMSFFENHTFVCSFLMIMILYIPYIVMSYPAILQGDAEDLIAQGFNLPAPQSGVLVLLNENVYLNGHHPLIYTMLIHVCLMLGKILFKSWNIGLFMVVFAQFLFAAMVISYFIQFLREIKVNLKLCIGVLLYYCISPRMVSYMLLLSKDTFYAYILLLIVIWLSKIFIFNRPLFSGKIEQIEGKQVNWKAILIVSFVGAVGVLFRNEGKYVFSLWYILLFVRFKKSRKMLMCGLAAIFLTTTFLTHVTMPYYKITPGSTREVLSVPFQQTARYVKEYPDDVTETERKVIDKVLVYDTLVDRYEPDRSDHVKDKWNKYTSKEDLKEYFLVWFQMLKKHPMIYVEATLNNYYYYVYPGGRLAYNYTYSWSEECMNRTNKATETVGMNLHYPIKLTRWRNAYETLRETVFSLPVLNLFRCTAIYIWLLLILIFYLLWKRNIDTLLVAVLPLLASAGIMFLGPCNGYYFRYAYMIAVALPAAIIFGLVSSKSGNRS